jgi:SAM-dependent methyltransferase
MASKKHWTERMFVERVDLYRPTLEENVERAVPEVEGLVRILRGFNVLGDGFLLDLACGIGRHSVILAEWGYRVVGFDISPAFISRAEELAKKRGVADRTEFIVGDTRAVGTVLERFRGRFDAVLNLFTSMGYYGEETDERVLSLLLALSVPDGLLVLDIANRDWIVHNFQAKGFDFGEDGFIMLAERKMDMETSWMHNVWRYYRREGEDLKHLETFEVDYRVYSLHELRGLIEGSGWVCQEFYGEFGMEPFRMESKRIIAVARKP